MDCNKYLSDKVQPVVDDFIVQLCKSKPEDPIPIMLQVLETHQGDEVPPLTESEEMELIKLKDKWRHRKLSQTRANPQVIKIDSEEAKGSKQPDTDSSSDSDDDDDTETFSRSAMLKVKPQAMKPPRISVSAEVVGAFNNKLTQKPIVIKKDDDTKKRITKRLKDSFMFKNLEDKDMEIVVDAMKEVHHKEGDGIINQGDDGNELYVLESGEWECLKVFPGSEVPVKLRDYVPGEAFGELALLYNAPRAATIKASDDVTLWALDRQTFNNIVKDASRKNRELYQKFLKSVDLLSSMDHYELVTLSDALKRQKYKKGDYIIQEGEIGDCFYFMVEGKAVAKKMIDGKMKDLMSYGVGDYFGERALLTNEPRAASIQATSDDLVVAKLENRSFKRLLGPVEEILMRNMKNYAKYHMDR